MSVYDNMAFSLSLRGTDKEEIEKRVEDAAEQLGILELLDRKPRELSGGQRQRVAVGRAIVRDPAAFLMDEPLSNLDAKLRVEARAMLQRLHQRLGSTFIYVTHDQVEAMTMGERIAVMKDGELMQVDPPQVLYDSPNNRFVAGFIGSPAMNFFESKLVRENGDMYVDADVFRVKVPEDKRKVWEQSLGEDVIMGIRPEDLHDQDYTPRDITPDKVKTKVDLIELLGDEKDLFLKSGDVEFVARVDPRSKIEHGDDVEIVFGTENMHLFDAETEEAIR